MEFGRSGRRGPRLLGACKGSEARPDPHVREAGQNDATAAIGREVPRSGVSINSPPDTNGPSITWGVVSPY